MGNINTRLAKLENLFKPPELIKHRFKEMLVFCVHPDGTQELLETWQWSKNGPLERIENDDTQQ